MVHQFSMGSNLLEKIRNDDIEYEVAEEGIVSHTYITEDAVVQEPDHGNGDRLRRNKHIVEKLAENDGPVPEILDSGEDPLYVVFEKLEGLSLDQRDQFEEEDYLQAVRNAGKALALIHQEEGSLYGKPRSDTDFEHGEFDEWIEFVKDYVQGTVDWAESEKFRPVAEKAREMIDIDDLPENPPSRILHMDYTPDNQIVDSNLDVKVIDFDGAIYGDPRFDLMYAKLITFKRGEEVAEEFMEGYEEIRDPKLRPELERNYTILAVLRDIRGGEWCLRNDKDVDLEEWRTGLENTLNDL